jgi:hypothetical protein
MRFLKLVAPCVSLAALVGCQGESFIEINSLQCGEGTVEENGTCVPAGTGGAGGSAVTTSSTGGAGGSAPTDTTAPELALTPDNGAFCKESGDVTVTVTSNEPATIYYTMDGSEPSTSSKGAINVAEFKMGAGTLKYFAVDSAGNASKVQSVDFAADGAAPAGVNNFAGKVENGKLTLTWKNPAAADFAGVVILSTVADQVSPETCSIYGVGGKIGQSRVEFVGNAETATLPVGLGMRSYSAYAVDKVGNYSPVSPSYVTQNIVDAGPQTASIEIADPTTNPSATVKTGPTGLGLTAMATTVDGTLELTLKVENTGFGFAWHAPKVILDATNQGDALGTGGTVGEKPFWRASDASNGSPIDIDAAQTFKVRLANIDGTKNPLKVDLSFTHSQVVYANSGNGAAFADLETGTRLGLTNSLNNVGSGNGSSRAYPTAVTITPDSRRMLYVGRSRGAISEAILPLGKIGRTVSVMREGVDSRSGYGSSILGDYAKGRVLTAMGARCHNNGNNRGGNGVIDLVAIDPVTLQELDRVELEPGGNPARRNATTITISPNGKYYAVVVGDIRDNQDGATWATLYLVDRDTLKLVDASPNDANSLGIVFDDMQHGNFGLRNVRSAEWLDDNTLVVAPWKDRGGQGSRPMYKLTLDLVNGATVTSYADFATNYNFYPNRLGRTVADGKGNVYVVGFKGDCNEAQGIELLTATDAQHFRSNNGTSETNWYENGESCPEIAAITLSPDGKHLYVAPRSNNSSRPLVEFDVSDLSKPSRRLTDMFTDNRGHWLAVTPH